MSIKTLYTVSEAAVHIARSPATIYGHVARDRLPVAFYTESGTMLFHPEDVERLRSELAAAPVRRGRLPRWMCRACRGQGQLPAPAPGLAPPLCHDCNGTGRAQGAP